MKIWLLGIFTVVAFSLNSIFNRAALADDLIDPVLFSLIRILSAALFLFTYVAFKGQVSQIVRGKWQPPIALLLYVLCFSLAYQSLSSGTGALILFATVQFVMIFFGLTQGQSLKRLQWLGVIIAFVGVIILLLPSAEKPSTLGAVLMILSGVGWAIYSIYGLTSKNAVLEVSRAFVLALPIVLIISIAFAQWQHISIEGAVLAVASGLFASGIGYCIWYLLLPYLTSAGAAALQLLVPVTVALMGILFLSEPITIQFAISSLLVVFGLALFRMVKV